MRGDDLSKKDRFLVRGEVELMQAKINFLRAALAPFAAGHVCDESLRNARTAYRKTDPTKL